MSAVSVQFSGTKPQLASGNPSYCNAVWYTGAALVSMLPQPPPVLPVFSLMFPLTSAQPHNGVTAGPKVQRPPACVLCPVTGPPLRRTSCGRFCHVGCAQWLEETFIQGGLVHGLRNVAKVITSLMQRFPPHCPLTAFGQAEAWVDHELVSIHALQ